MAPSVKATIVLATGALAQGYTQILAPASDINSPAGQNAKEPLKWLGANGPWFPGDQSVNGIPSTVPEGCVVDQAAYISRHGSRYPDNGAYNGWVSASQRFAGSNGYTATGALSFLPNWKPVLTNPAMQIAQENPTGMKEAFDMGYQLRTRYPHFHEDGNEFMVWANNYTRVLQTAEKFVQGYLGAFARTNGSVIAVTGKGFPQALGDTLAPSDMCPTFKDTEGSEQQGKWDKIWIPAVQARLQALITGNLTLTPGDITLGPYLCGFESAITGRLSPWCDVFTDDELKSYQYSNDMRYYYGIGPGTPINKKMMTPYLEALVKLLQKGPGQKGIREDGQSSFDVPKLLVSFLNDGQLTELITSSGVFDNQKPLDPEHRDDSRLWIGNRFVTMRGTIAFERLTCKGTPSGPPGGSPSGPSAGPSGTPTSSGSPSGPSNTASSVSPSGTISASGAPSGTASGSPSGTASGAPSGTASSVVPSGTASASVPGSGSGGSPYPTHRPCGHHRRQQQQAQRIERGQLPPSTFPRQVPTTNGTSTDQHTFIRVLLNDAVYPIPSCQNGPGKSCLLGDYVKYIENKIAEEGDWLKTCNVTDPAAPTKVKGASFYTDLSGAWLKRVGV